MYGNVSISTEVEISIETFIEEAGAADILEEIGREDICNYLSAQFENEDLIEMLDIRVPSPLDIDLLTIEEKRQLLWDLIKGNTGENN